MEPTDQQILDGAPVGARDWTHYANGKYYQVLLNREAVAVYLTTCRRWGYVGSVPYGMRSRGDIQRLADAKPESTCYECGSPAYELSPRSRCCACEYRRAKFNELENEQLRANGGVK